jgi:transcriptional regulator with XRE-family HTH domain
MTDVQSMIKQLISVYHSESEVAKLLGVDPANVNNWKLGRANPSKANLEKILKLYRETIVKIAQRDKLLVCPRKMKTA